MALVNDDFPGSSLGGHWTVYDPVGDCTVSVSSGQLQMSLPEASNHDAVGPGHEALMVVQSHDDTDFEVTVKIDSDIAGGTAYIGAGIVVRTDSDTYLRFDFIKTSSVMYAFCAYIDEGSVSTKFTDSLGGGYTAPQYLRITRTDDDFVVEYSDDGSSWTPNSFTQAMTANEVGCLAYNVGDGGEANAPAFTALFDYFDAGEATGVTGTVDFQESEQDTSTITGEVTVEGAVSTTEAESDSTTITGEVTVTGDASFQESESDSTTIAGIVGALEGTAVFQEAETDSSTITGEVTVEGAASFQESETDSSTIAGEITVEGTAEFQEGETDTTTITGVVGVNEGTAEFQEAEHDTTLITGHAYSFTLPALVSILRFLTTDDWDIILREWEKRREHRLRSFERTQRDRI